MLNKTLTISASILYAILLGLIGWQQAKTLRWTESSFLRVSLSRSVPLAQSVTSIPPAKVHPPQFSLVTHPLTLTQQNWASILFQKKRQKSSFKLQEVQSHNETTRLVFQEGPILTWRRQQEGAALQLAWPQGEDAGELLLPFPLNAGFQWVEENKTLLAVKQEQRWSLTSNYPLSLKEGKLLVRLPALEKTQQVELLQLAPAPLARPGFASDFNAYIKQLELLLLARVKEKSNPSVAEQNNYYAMALRQGEFRPLWSFAPAQQPYLLAPYLGPSLQTLQQQVRLDQQQVDGLMQRSLEQLNSAVMKPSAASFLFNHYQLEKLRQLLSYSFEALARPNLEQQIDSLFSLSEVLLINPVMVSAQGDLALIARTMEQQTLPALRKWLEQPPTLALSQQLKAIALLHHWARYQQNASSRELAQLLTLQLQRYQDPSGDLRSEAGEVVSLHDLLSWVDSDQYRSRERAVTAGFWIQGISEIVTDYRPGHFIRISTKFPAGQTQYLILRGIYFQPQQVLLDDQVQPYDPSLAKGEHKAGGSGWFYQPEIKTLVIKATHSKPEFIINIPY